MPHNLQLGDPEMVDSQVPSTLVDRLIEVARELSATSDVPRLLEKIVETAKEFTRAEGSTLYRVEPNRGLIFSILLNDKLGLRCGGASPPCTLPDVPLFLPDGNPNLSNVCAFAAFRRQTVNLADAYQSEGFDFSGTQKADAALHYRSQSFLTVPLLNHRRECLAILQLINRRDEKGTIGPFSKEDVAIAEALAAQGAIALENRELLSDYQAMFEAAIGMLADAVDQRSPFTGRHSRRIPLLSVELARAVNRTETGPLAGVHISDEQIEALRLGSLLHDVGKIAIPDALLDKKTRLWSTSDGIEQIRLRYRCLSLERQRQEPPADQPDAAALEQEIAFLAHCDAQGTVVTDQDRTRIAQIQQQRAYLWRGELCPVLSPQEAEALSQPTGTLTDRERQELNQHPLRSYELLSKIPFPGVLAQVPLIARNHHEWCNGKGYPLGLHAKDLDILSRIVPLADVFEALTAPDRPYRKPATVSEANEVLRKMAQEGHLDPDLVQIFIDQQVGKVYGQQQLEAWQLV